MRCPECLAEQVAHHVTYSTHTIPGASITFFDEQDKSHVHDSTKLMTYMVCSNGHRWEHEGRNPCPTCRKPVDVEVK